MEMQWRSGTNELFGMYGGRKMPHRWAGFERGADCKSRAVMSWAQKGRYAERGAHEASTIRLREDLMAIRDCDCDWRYRKYGSQARDGTSAFSWPASEECVLTLGYIYASERSALSRCERIDLDVSEFQPFRAPTTRPQTKMRLLPEHHNSQTANPLDPCPHGKRLRNRLRRVGGSLLAVMSISYSHD